MKFIKIIALLCIVINSHVFAQNEEIDSLATLLKSDVDDSVFVKANVRLAIIHLYSNTDTSEYFANKALNTAQKINSAINILKAYKIIGSCHVLKGDNDKALSYMGKSLGVGKEVLKNEPKNREVKIIVSGIYGTLGLIHYNMGSYDLAIKNHLESLELSEEIGFDKGISICLSNIGIVYMEMLDNEKALEYHYRALKIAKKMGELQEITQSLNNLGAVYLNMPIYDSAYYYISKCVQINLKENETELIVNYENLAHIFDMTGQPDSALYYNGLAINISEKLDNMEGMVDCNHRMAEIYYNMGDYGRAEKFSKKCLDLSSKSEMQYMQLNANEQLSKIYKAKGDYKNAYAFFVESSKLKDSVFSTERDERIADMETKYQSEKKEEEIKLLHEKAKLQKEMARNNKLIFISITVTLVLILVLSIISYRSSKHKQLAEKRRLQQKAEKNVLDAIIETEYKERKRFAEDLHDGLGVMLSTLRLYINELTDKGRTDKEQQQLLEQSNIMLDDAIANARNISNNIMPGALKNNGLEIALKSYCDKINASGKIKIILKSDKLEKHYKETIEITLFRVLAEMINNTLKHSGAKQININITGTSGKISVFYTDNGNGFDYGSIQKLPKKGMGLNNIKSRINSIGGKCTIESSKGKGFQSRIEVVTS
jgi:signal transduction histidine kinase